MGWRDYAKQVHGAEDNRANSAVSSQKGPIVPNVPIVPPLDPARALKLCRARLTEIDPDIALHGIPLTRWRRLIEDVTWIFDNFAPAALGNGGTSADLFGLYWWDDADTMRLKDGWGGVADRLQGSRSLVMDEHAARWRVMFTGSPDMFAAGTYPLLRPLWES